MKNYQEIIRDLRTDRDLTQTDIAKVLGTKQQHYSKYENGENEMPVRAFVVLADFFGVSVDYLLGRPAGGQDYDVLESKINSNTTAGEVISDILSLDPANCDAVVDYIFMQKLKEEHYRQNEKSNSRQTDTPPETAVDQ